MKDKIKTQHEPLYHSWLDIRRRCNDPTYKNYKDYGARGISICNEWRDNFKAFYDYATQLPNYGKAGLTLDRINNNGNYEPGNLRWTTRLQQVLNRRTKSRSGFTGVIFHKQVGKYDTRITVNGKRITIGYFDTPLQAATARDWYIVKNGLWEYPLQIIRKTA